MAGGWRPQGLLASSRSQASVGSLVLDSGGDREGGMATPKDTVLLQGLQLARTCSSLSRGPMLGGGLRHPSLSLLMPSRPSRVKDKSTSFRKKR